MQCSSCQLLRINGIVCHEIGCPDSWKTTTRECKNCGCEFAPEDRRSEFCDVQCYGFYWGYIDANCGDDD